MASKILVNGDLEQHEFKGEDLLQNRRLRMHSAGTPSPSVLVVEECLQMLVACRCATFGVLSNPGHIDEIQKSDQCPIQYVRLLQRIDRWIREEHPGQVAIPVFDSIHGGTNSHLTRQIAKYLHRHALGKAMVRIVPAPFWIDSTTTAGSQLADIVAHILMNSMMPLNERKAIEFLWQRVVALRGGEGAYRTITKIATKPTGRD